MPESNELIQKEAPNLPVQAGLIPREVIEDIIDDADNRLLYAKVAKEGGGFVVDDEIISEIVGHIVNLDRYWCRWEQGTCSKNRSKESPGEEWDRRCDIQVATVDGFLIQIGLSPSSYNRLAGLVKYLAGRRLSLEKQLLTFGTKEVNGNFGVFQVVTIKRADAPNRVQIVEDDILF